MRVVAATPLLRDAAEVLGPVRDDVVVIGALAVQVALAGHDVALTPTRDVDAGVATDAVEHVVSHLEAEGLQRSGHERAFTWVRDELKVQLLRPFHPFPKGAARGLPINNVVTELVAHRTLVALDTEPDEGRFWVATPAALVALKEAAFGRTRPDGKRSTATSATQRSSSTGWPTRSLKSSRKDRPCAGGWPVRHVVCTARTRRPRRPRASSSGPARRTRTPRPKRPCGAPPGGCFGCWEMNKWGPKSRLVPLCG